MRTFVIILRMFGYALSLALLAYFVVRELEDQWLVGRFLETPSAAEVVVEPPIDDIPAEEPEPAEPGPEPVAVVESEALHFDAASTRASLEGELMRTQAALAKALEAKLLQNLDRVHSAYRERGAVMEDARQTVGSLIAELDQENAETSKELSEVFMGIQVNLAALSESDAALDRALEQWSDAFRSLSEVEKISARAVDERNYEFVPYTVGSTETLAEIAQKLAREYDMENVDLGTLIPMFNEVEMRSRNLGTRRGTIRVVANDTLRIPIPKTSGELLADQQLGEQMQAQRATIVGAKARQGAVRAELGGQVQRLRNAVQRVEGLRELTRLMGGRIENLDSSDALEVTRDEATDDQRAAWDAFNTAFRDYRSVSDIENQRFAKERLEAATRTLFDAYITDDAEGARADPLHSASAAPGPGDLDWLQSFIERYEPR